LKETTSTVYTAMIISYKTGSQLFHPIQSNLQMDPIHV